ncbi:MAG: OOP family OmpA-OmpF porin [Porticoccaceae bacterium]|jgi:OOP family OmpA-OmpF porin
MKHLNKTLIALMMLMGVNSNAQDSNNPWAVSFGVNGVDTNTRVSGANKVGGQDAFLYKTFAVNENWNILPSVSYIGVSKYIGNNFSFGVQGSVNKIEKAVYFRPTDLAANSDGYIVTNPGDLMYYGVDFAVKYSFMNLIKSKVIDPTLNLGGGYVWLGEASYGVINPGAGVTFWFSDNIGLSLAATLKKSFGDREDDNGVIDSPSHLQYTAGLSFKFGGKDTDGDGIYDKDDACPEVAGLKEFNGCPDTDGDGIIDGNDACPDVFGLAVLDGCPDTDGDGISDKDDACPDVFGLVALKGCPDADGDGVTDKEDKCPTLAGAKENAGCPWPDADGDSVLDKDDDCPEVAGTVANKGCPEITQADLDAISLEARSVFFNSGKATFKTADVPVRLEAIAAILKNYPNANFVVEGHTDNTGSDKLNQKLSEERANAVKEAVIRNGVVASKITTIGYGESTPLASNKTAAGRAENRRTEVKLVK